MVHDGSTVDHMIFKRLVGNLMYLTTTRPDIMYGVILISIFMESPKDSHWQAGKRILRFVGSLMYLTTTRPDIMYGVSLVSKFMPLESR